MPIYTRTGDQGETDLLDSVRVPKDVSLLEVCGTLDEFSALLGLARCEPLSDGAGAILERMQRHLLAIGIELVAVEQGRTPPATIGLHDVAAIEQVIDRYEAQLAPLGAFILPGGTQAAATLHLARAVCRRTERRLVSLART